MSTDHVNLSCHLILIEKWHQNAPNRSKWPLQVLTAFKRLIQCHEGVTLAISKCPAIPPFHKLPLEIRPPGHWDGSSNLIVLSVVHAEVPTVASWFPLGNPLLAYTVGWTIWRTRLKRQSWKDSPEDTLGWLIVLIRLQNIAPKRHARFCRKLWGSFWPHLEIQSWHALLDGQSWKTLLKRQSWKNPAGRHSWLVDCIN